MFSPEREFAEVAHRLAADASFRLYLDKFHSIYIINNDGAVFPLHPVLGGIWDS